MENARAIKPWVFVLVVFQSQILVGSIRQSQIADIKCCIHYQWGGFRRAEFVDVIYMLFVKRCYEELPRSQYNIPHQ